MPRSSFRLAGRSPPSTGDPSGADLQRGITGNAAFKGHVAVDPDSEVITSTVVTPGNAGDASVAADLIEDLLGDGDETDDDDGAKPTVYGDNAYGTGEFQSKLEHADIASGCKTQPPMAAGGLFTKDRFNIDLGASTITCPNNVTVPVRYGPDGNGIASFGRSCTNCALRACCTTAAGGRTIGVGAHEDALAHARDRQKGPEWAAQARAPHATPPWRAASPCTWPDESRCRFQLTCRGHQPGPPGRARALLHPERMDGGQSVNRSP